MKRKIKVNWIGLILVLCVAAAILFWLGVGPYSSGSAVSDLYAELESVYGPEYTGKVVENGTEDMVFEIEPKTWFLTNWDLRNALGLAYQYECRVIITTHFDGASDQVQTIIYQASDPMGDERQTQRAKIDWDSETEQVQ